MPTKKSSVCPLKGLDFERNSPPSKGGAQTPVRRPSDLINEMITGLHSNMYKAFLNSNFATTFTPLNGNTKAFIRKNATNQALWNKLLQNTILTINSGFLFGEHAVYQITSNGIVLDMDPATIKSEAVLNNSTWIRDSINLICKDYFVSEKYTYSQRYAAYEDVLKLLTTICKDKHYEVEGRIDHCYRYGSRIQTFRFTIISKCQNVTDVEYVYTFIESNKPDKATPVYGPGSCIFGIKPLSFETVLNDSTGNVIRDFFKTTSHISKPKKETKK